MSILNTLSKKIHVVNVKKGFYDNPREIGTLLMLVVSELSEALEADRKIRCHPLYYDEDGKFHVERRLGCQGCPLMGRKKRVEFFKINPKWLKAWIRAFSKTRDLRETYERLTIRQ